MTRFFRWLLSIRGFFSLRSEILRKRLTSLSFALLRGLRGGSLVGSFLDAPRSLGRWDGGLIFLFVLLTEARTRVYHVRLKGSTRLLCSNVFKLGCRYGVLIDAFKVGS